MAEQEVTLTRLTDRDGRTWLRANDVADVIRELARRVEVAPIVEGREIGDWLRVFARNLEGKP